MADRAFSVVVERCGVVTLRDEPVPEPVRDGQFDVATVFSGLSTGTDLSWVKGTNPALHRRWDPELGLFMPGAPDVGYPIDKFGYMQVGRVTESATPAVRPGDLLAMTYGHRSAYRADALTVRFVKLSSSLDPVLGIYAAHMGPICANALVHAAARSPQRPEAVSDQSLLWSGSPTTTSVMVSSMGWLWSRVSESPRTSRTISATVALIWPPSSRSSVP